MTAAVAALRRWWAGRRLSTRITLAVGGVALVALLALGRLGAGLVLDVLADAADGELADRAAAGAQRLAAAPAVPVPIPQTGSIAPGSAGTGSAAPGSAGTGPAAPGSAGTGSAAPGSGATGSAAPGSAGTGSAAPGQAAAEPIAAVPSLRVVDRSGNPADGGPPVPVRSGAMRALAAGEPVTTVGPAGPVRWAAAPVVTADGSTRFVLASADLLGGGRVAARAVLGFLLGAVVVALVVTTAAWLAGRAALTSVDRMRRSTVALAPGERLPLPPADDELRALAGEINALLARRDDTAARLERFTGDAAHEMRSPLASLRAQAEVAVAHPDPALSEDTLRSVAGEAQRLSVLLDGLLALARADAGRRPEARPVDLAAASRAAVARAKRDDGPALQLITPGPAVVRAAPGEIDLVLDNLLGNAARYTRSLVRVAVLPAGRWARLVVDDDGPGIPEEDRVRVFDRFTRLEPDAGGGSGLGLALVAAVVGGRGGRVTASAAPTGGARLEVRWPAEPHAP